MNEDGLVGFADSLGNVVIKPQFESDYMRSCARLEAGEAMLFSIPVSWNVSHITDPNYKQRFSSGKLSPGKYKIGLQLEIYMNTEFEVK